MRTVSLILVLAAAASAGDPAVTATLEPVRIRLGQVADLSVTVAARKADALALPVVDGLDFERLGESSSVRIDEGVASAATTYHIRVIASRAGSFAIPPIEATVGGLAVRSEPLELTVVPVAVPAPAVAPPPAPDAPSIPRPGSPRPRGLRPAWESSWFQHGGLALVIALAVAILVLRHLERGPRRSSLRALKAETDRAIAESDAWMFFAMLRAASQERLAPHWQMAPRAITLAELRSRGASGVLQELFEIADAVAYSGRAVEQEEMRIWQQRVLAELARMEKAR